jgi:hypothetical protein
MNKGEITLFGLKKKKKKEINVSISYNNSLINYKLININYIIVSEYLDS